tara:strand:- start:782 stop:967 length:186 start_codon:yes stop_codon:yes gene_type:complete
MGRKMRQSITERKMMVSIKGMIDVKLNEYGLKFRRIENEIRVLKMQNRQLKNEIKTLKGEE